MKTELETLLRARYSVIYVITYEEERVVSDLKKICSDFYARKIYTWTLTCGLRTIEGKSLANTFSPEDALTYIEDYRQDGETIFVLLDFHPYLRHPSVQSLIKNLSRRLRGTSNNIILISPILDLPLELDKDIKTLDYALPAFNEIDGFLESVCPDMKTRHAFIAACRGFTLKEIQRVIFRAFEQKDFSSLAEVLEEKKQIIRKTGLLEFYSPFVDFEDIGGLGKLKNWLIKRGKCLSYGESWLDQPRGVLLLGVPGCGKSLVAGALAREWNRPLLKLDVGRLFSPLMGSTEENLRRAILTTEAMAPAILWLDNVDRGFSGVKRSTDSGVSRRIFASFINWLQEKSSPVFVLGTTNSISNLPAEFLRKGRFDEIFFIDLPNYTERKKIFEINIKKFAPLADKELDILGFHSDGLSGFEIKKVVNSALYDCYEREETLSSRAILMNIQDMLPLSFFLQDQIKSLREWARVNARPAS